MTNSRPLSELEPRFRNFTNGSKVVRFRCPDCVGGADGKHPHTIDVNFEGPSPFPSGSTWRLENADLAKLTICPSVNCDVRPEYDPAVWTPEDIEQNERTRCRFHGVVENGVVKW